jgi:hypothetical protein
MSGENIDKEYLDSAFVSQLNSIDDESLKHLCNYVLSTYKTEYNYEDLEKLNQECQNIIDNDLNIENFIRQLKYLFNKGIYGRINKKHKAQLLELGLTPEKMEIISEMEKQYFELNLEKNDNEEKNQILTLKDFDMHTEMPVVDTKYNTMVDGEKNEDFKKQKLYINLRLNKNGKDKREVIQVDKTKLIGLFSQMEKLQEQLDKIS